MIAVHEYEIIGVAVFSFICGALFGTALQKYRIIIEKR